MQAGKLRHRVSLQAFTAGSPQQNAYGEPDAAWTTVSTVYASIRPLSGRELFLASQTQSKVEAEIEIRYISGVTADMRVLHGTTVYDIEAVIDEDELHRCLRLRCSKGLNQG